MLVREPSQDWSRLSDVSKVAEAEDVAAASTIVSQLAKSPAKPIDPVINEGNENSRDSFAEMSFDDTTSGLTLFDGYRASPAKVMPTAEEQATESVSFLAGVLERSTHGSSKSDVKPCNSMGPPPAKESGAEREPLSFMGSPRKRKATAALDVATPTAVRSSLFSSPGTPFGMSPGFRMSPMSKIGFSPGSMNEGVTLDTFPGGRSLDSYDAHHSFHPNASRMSVGSRVRFDDAKETPAKAELFGDNSTMLANDLEIVSALNALSHSPAKSPYGVTLPAAEYRATGSPGEGKHTASNDDRTATNGVMTSKKPKSLFEKVVGDNKIENKSVASTAKKSNTTKKRKLKF